ncbi:HIRAN domain-containing protein [Clostridium formicaceticum]|nr:HIRAN domain-containing protein [Clostridium formicaceticum]
MKFIYVINKQAEIEFEKILYYKNLKFQKYSKQLDDGREINIYTGILRHYEKYTLEDNPARVVFRTAEDAGIRIGFYYYSGMENFKELSSLSLIRSFPIESDDFGDFSSASGGFRQDLKAGFKSSWEANIARILNKQNANWKYEIASESYATDIGYYIPDFFIQRENGIDILEVKGFWDSRSIRKVSSAIEQAKDEKIIVIDKDYYSLLEEKYGSCISNWEKTGKIDTSFEVPVVGINVKNRFNIAQKLVHGEKLKILREPENAYDSNAIKILTLEDEEVGYIAKDWASIFAFKIDNGFTYECFVHKIEITKKRIIIKLQRNKATLDLLKNIGF